MPRKGGDAAKAGIVYEVNWTILNGFIPVIIGDAESIFLEPVEEASNGIEYRLKKDKSTTVCQCKISADLENVNKLEPVLKKLLASMKSSDTNAELVLVTGAKLESIVRQLRLSEGEDGWELALGVEDKKLYEGLVKNLWDNDNNLADSQLKLIKVNVVGRSYLEEQVKEKLGKIFGPDQAMAALCALSYQILTNLGFCLTREKITAHLENCEVSIPSISKAEVDLLTKKMIECCSTIRVKIDKITRVFSEKEDVTRWLDPIEEQIASIQDISDYPRLSSLGGLTTRLVKAAIDMEVVLDRRLAELYDQLNEAKRNHTIRYPNIIEPNIFRYLAELATAGIIVTQAKLCDSDAKKLT